MLTINTHIKRVKRGALYPLNNIQGISPNLPCHHTHMYCIRLLAFVDWHFTSTHPSVDSITWFITAVSSDRILQHRDKPNLCRMHCQPLCMQNGRCYGVTSNRCSTCRHRTRFEWKHTRYRKYSFRNVRRDTRMHCRIYWNITFVQSLYSIACTSMSALSLFLKQTLVGESDRVGLVAS
jgi:hypothetical protein